MPAQPSPHRLRRHRADTGRHAKHLEVSQPSQPFAEVRHVVEQIGCRPLVLFGRDEHFFCVLLARVAQGHSPPDVREVSPARFEDVRVFPGGRPPQGRRLAQGEVVMVLPEECRRVVGVRVQVPGKQPVPGGQGKRVVQLPQGRAPEVRPEDGVYQSIATGDTHRNEIVGEALIASVVHL
jgi:hypothetical protein